MIAKHSDVVDQDLALEAIAKRKRGVVPSTREQQALKEQGLTAQVAALAEEAKAGATALLTTEKDVMNLPQGWKSTIPILACVTEIELEPAAAFDELLAGSVETSRMKN